LPVASVAAAAERLLVDCGNASAMCGRGPMGCSIYALTDTAEDAALLKISPTP